MTESYFPAVRHPFRISKPALALILATILLAVILAVATLRNINREQNLMEHFLLQQGLTLIRAFEAGARTSMMHLMTGSDPLDTLITETVAEESIAYIRIVDEHAHLVSEAGNLPGPVDKKEVGHVLELNRPVTALDRTTGVFEIGRKFTPLPPLSPLDPVMAQRWNDVFRSRHDQGELIIFIGLLTREFDVARQEDVRHTIFMGAMLFLLGSGGLYFLFLYQEMRVGRATLATMRRYTENVIESMPDGLITLDGEDSILSCNSKAEELIGRPQSEVVGRQIGDVLSACPMEQLRKQKEVLNKLILCTQEGREEIAMRVSGSQLLGHDGNRIGTVLMLRDIRDIRSMEQQLERARRMAALGKMAAGIAHEIRNPLGTLRGFAQYFGNQAATNAEGRQYANLMVSEVDRLNQTISALLQFARPREPHFTETEVNDLLTRTGRLMEADCLAHSVTLTVQCSEGKGIQLQADPDLLLQVLLNLLKNSIIATPAGGEVTLSAGQDEDSVRIRVHDTGQGMGEEEKERMFDPFFTTRKEGTGLGLAVSHQIVEQHNGRFEVESQPGRGTAITLVLPRSR